MICEPLSCSGLSRETFCLVNCISRLGDLSTHPGCFLGTKAGMRGATTLRSVCVIKIWLSCSSRLEFLDTVIEDMDDEGSEDGAY